MAAVCYGSVAAGAATLALAPSFAAPAWNALSLTLPGRSIFHFARSNENLRVDIKQLYGQACPDHRYTTEFISWDPLVTYLNDFVSVTESRYLIELAENYYNGFRVADHAVQAFSPRSATLPKSDPVVSCIGQRAMRFLGALDHEDYEPPWLVKYLPGQKLNLHNDPSSADDPMIDENGRKFHRWATFFIYLESNCTGGETLFPNLPRASQDANATKFAPTKTGTGMALRPLEGSGAFWINFRQNGSNHQDLVHGGLPLRSGYKYGLNIFSKKWAD